MSQAASDQQTALWLSHAVSQTGRWVHGFALSWWTWTLSDSPLWLGLVAAAGSLPMLLLFAVAGGVVDRCDRRRLLLCTQAASLLLALLTAVLGIGPAPSLVCLLAIATVYGVVAAFDAPALQSLLIASVGSGNSAVGVARQSLVLNGARIAAPLLAVGLIERGGVVLCFLANALSFVPILLLIARSSMANLPAPVADSGAGQPSLTQLVLSSPMLASTVATLVPLCLVAVPCVTLMPALAGAMHGAVPQALGGMMSAMAAGSLAGAALLRLQPQRLGASYRLLGAVLVFCVSLTQWADAGVLQPTWGFVSGASLALALGAASGRLQAAVAPAARGRISAVYCALVLGMAPLGHLFVGGLASQLGVTNALPWCALAAATMSVVMPALALRWRERLLPRLERPLLEPPAPAARR